MVAEQAVAHVSVESLCLVFVRIKDAPTARGETRRRSLLGRTNPWSPVSSSGGNSDGPKRRRRRPTVQTEGQTTQKEFSSSGNPGISSRAWCPTRLCGVCDGCC